MNEVKDFYYSLDKLYAAQKHLGDIYSSFIDSDQPATVYRGMSAYMDYIQENISGTPFIIALDSELASQLGKKRDRYFLEQSRVSLWGSWRKLWLIYFSVDFEKVGVPKQVDQVSQPNYLQFRSRMMQVIDASTVREDGDDSSLINVFENHKDWDPVYIEKIKDDFNGIHIYLIQEIEKYILNVEHEKVPVVMYKDPENINRYFLENKKNKRKYHGLIEKNKRPVAAYSVLGNLAVNKKVDYSTLGRIYNKPVSDALNEIFARTKLNEKIESKLEIGSLVNITPFDFIVKNSEQECVELSKKVIFSELN